jgi:hypothetical protein
MPTLAVFSCLSKFTAICRKSAILAGTWVYSLLLLAGYRTFGLARAPDVPIRWWRGSGRWSFVTLLRAFRTALWGKQHFRPIFTPTPYDWGGKLSYLDALKTQSMLLCAIDLFESLFLVAIYKNSPQAELMGYLKCQSPVRS